MKVKCVALKYFAGDYCLVQGIKGGGVPGRTYYSKGRRIEQEGFGYGRSITPSKLVLYAESDKHSFEIRVDPYFKENVGKLTEKRRNKIKNAMPDEIRIHKEAGESFYRADESDLKAWKKAAGL